MFKDVRKLGKKARNEVYAWLGTIESLSYKVDCITDHIPEYAHQHLSFDLGTSIPAALREGRLLLLIFLRTNASLDAGWHVLTIDRVTCRVDRWLSSAEVLRDPNDDFPYLITVDDVRPSLSEALEDRSVIRIVHSAVSLLSLPIVLARFPLERVYRTWFQHRQEEITASQGYSRRFASVVACVGTQLDTETRAVLQKSMLTLWKFEQSLKRTVDVTEAETVLMRADVCVTQSNNPLDWQPYDPGPLVESWAWTDHEGEVIASGCVYQDLQAKSLDATTTHLRVLGSFFEGVDAEQLCACHHKKTVIDKRNASVHPTTIQA